MRTVSLDKEAYNLLEAHKREDESFSEVVKRLASDRSWREVAGILADDEAEELERIVDEGRERSQSHWEKTDTDGWTDE